VLYAVTWKNGCSRILAGSLEVGREALHLRGGVDLDLPYDEIVSANVGRAARDRVRGRQSLVLELVSGEVVRIASMNGPGTLTEVVERIEPLAAGAR
jgi:hypothetical protein